MARRASSQIAGAARQQVEYASALFSKFCGHIDAMGGQVRLLDLGPSMTGNVMYWVRAGHPVSALDITVHETVDEIRLDHEDCAFGGVLGWTALSHLEPSSARQLMREIGRVLRSDGWLFAIFDGDGRKPAMAHRYRIIDADTLGFEPIDGCGAPRPVLTREVETLFQPFRETRIMVMRHGSREALGRRP